MPQVGGFFVSTRTPIMLSTDRFLAIDTETTGPTFYAGARAFAVSTCNQDGDTFYLEAPVCPDSRTPQWRTSQLNSILELITSYDTFVFHNASFDIKALFFLPRIGKKILEHLHPKQPTQTNRSIHDTMVLCHILDSKSPKGLKDLSLMYLDIDDDDEEDLSRTVKSLRLKAKTVGWSYAIPDHPTLPGVRGSMHKMDMWLPRAWASSEHFRGSEEQRSHLLNVCKTYAVTDAVRTAGLFHLFAGRINQDEGSLKAYELQQKCIFPLFEMETHGLHLLDGKFERETEEYQTQAQYFINSMRSMIGDPNFNPDSTQELQEVLFHQLGFEPVKETKTGYSTDKSSLSALLLQRKRVPFRSYRFVKQLVHYRATNSALKYLKSYDRFHRNHYLYPNMNLVGTSTTRLSSSQPNGQNVGKGKETEEVDEQGNPIIQYSLRRVFGPPEGKVWYAVDYDQLQIRIFAFLSQEQSLIEAIRNGFDFHTKVASDLYETDTPTKAQRKTAKYVNFGIIFGAGERRIQALSGDPDAYRRFTKLYPNVAEYIARTSSEVRQNGFIRTASGYPLTVPVDKAYAGVNYRVQGTEGDIVKQALYQLYSHFRTYNDPISIILQVHDEFIFECPKDFQFPTNLICSVMESCGEMYGVECKAKPEIITTNWAEGREIERTSNVSSNLPNRISRPQQSHQHMQPPIRLRNPKSRIRK